MQTENGHFGLHRCFVNISTDCMIIIKHAIDKSDLRQQTRITTILYRSQ